MFKPNFLAWRRDGDIACVNPAFLLESIKVFLDAGARIAILETPAVQTAPAVIRAMKLEGELARLGVTVASFSEFAPIKQFPGQCFHHLEIAREYLDYDAVVDVAKAKTHGMMMLTLCVKNLFGMIKGSERMDGIWPWEKISNGSRICFWTFTLRSARNSIFWMRSPAWRGTGPAAELRRNADSLPARTIRWP